MRGYLEVAYDQNPVKYTGKDCKSSNDCVMMGFRCERVGVKNNSVWRRCVCRFNPQFHGQSDTCKSIMALHHDGPIETNDTYIRRLDIRICVVLGVTVIGILITLCISLCCYLIRRSKKTNSVRLEK